MINLNGTSIHPLFHLDGSSLGPRIPRRQSEGIEVAKRRIRGGKEEKKKKNVKRPWNSTIRPTSIPIPSHLKDDFWGEITKRPTSFRRPSHQKDSAVPFLTKRLACCCIFAVSIAVNGYNRNVRGKLFPVWSLLYPAQPPGNSVPLPSGPVTGRQL